MRRWRWRRRAVFIAAIAGGVALLLAASVVVADRTGLDCLAYGPSGPPTLTDGPVAVGTDASVYAPDAPIVITGTNRTGAPIYLYPQLVEWDNNCSGYEVERRAGGGWQPVDVQHCAGDQASGGYRGVVDSLAPGQSSTPSMYDPLAPGTYRFVVRYIPQSAVPPDPRFGPADAKYAALAYWAKATRVPSAPFRVCICARCD